MRNKKRKIQYNLPDSGIDKKIPQSIPRNFFNAYICPGIKIPGCLANFVDFPPKAGFYLFLREKTKTKDHLSTKIATESDSFK